MRYFYSHSPRPQYDIWFNILQTHCNHEIIQMILSNIDIPYCMHFLTRKSHCSFIYFVQKGKKVPTDFWLFPDYNYLYALCLSAHALFVNALLLLNVTITWFKECLVYTNAGVRRYKLSSVSIFKLWKRSNGTTTASSTLYRDRNAQLPQYVQSSLYLVYSLYQGYEASATQTKPNQSIQRCRWRWYAFLPVWLRQARTVAKMGICHASRYIMEEAAVCMDTRAAVIPLQCCIWPTAISCKSETMEQTQPRLLPALLP